MQKSPQNVLNRKYSRFDLPINQRSKCDSWSNHFKIMLSPFLILVVIAIIVAVLSLIWPSYPLLPVSVLLLGIAMLIGGHPILK